MFEYETEPTVYSPHLRRLESQTILQMKLHIIKTAPSPQLFKDLEFLIWPGFESTTAQCSTK